MGRRVLSALLPAAGLLAAGLLAVGLLPAGCAAPLGQGSDAAWWQADGAPTGADAPLPGHPPRFREVRRSSSYVTMRDGVRLAVELYLPAPLPAGERIPAILFQTRYVRALDYRWPFGMFMGGRFDDTIEYMVRRGYAWLAVDARGSGASFGTRPYPYAPAEVRDGAEIADWISAQPWSDGRVGAFGNSYTGGSALMLLTQGHPAVRAAMPRFAMFDLYAEAVFPGGLQLRWLTDTWGRLAAALDSNRLGDFFGRHIDLAVAGVLPVDRPGGERMLAAAVRRHRGNGDIRRLVRGLVYRDDSTGGARAMTIDAISPHHHLPALERSGAEVYVYSGWYDAAFVLSAVHLFMNLDDPRTRLTIGPWDHGGRQNISPFAAEREPRFARDAEILRFFDHALAGRDTGIAAEQRVHYFTMGAERWRAAATWPPPGHRHRPLYLAAGARLRPAPAAGGRDAYRVDPSASTGAHSRWDALVNLKQKPIRYGDRSEADRKLLCYDSAPLARPLEVTGHPRLHLHLDADAADAAVFVYLEDVFPGGRVQYVTEGMLRARHRRIDPDPPYRTPVVYRSYTRAAAAPLPPGRPVELVIPLLPTSYEFGRGHRLRVALAGADAGHFAPIEPQATVLGVHRGAAHPSRIELPTPPDTPAEWFAGGGREEAR